MNFNDTLTNNYASFLNQIYRFVDVKKYTSDEDYKVKLNKKFGLEDKYSHDIIESCYWTLEDSEEAINNFLKFGNQGPTRYENNLGEKYLRFFGVLNAINIQHLIIKELYDIFKVLNKESLIIDLKKVAIIELRNKLASHNVNYKDQSGFDFFKIARYSIRDNTDNVQFVSKENKRESFELKNEIILFKEILHKHLQIISEHLVSRYFKSESKRFKELTELTDLLNKKRNGAIISENLNGEYLVFEVDKSKIKDIINE